MALDGTYSGLCASVAAWLNVDDITAAIPDFITLAEATLNSRLRMGQMETITTLGLGSAIVGQDNILVTSDTGEPLITSDTGDDLIGGLPTGSSVSLTTLPTDCLEIRMVVANTSPRVTLGFAGAGWSIDSYDSLAGFPSVYTMVGTSLVVYPTTTETLALTYYARIPALSAANQSNWLLTNYPNVYLYGALVEASPYLLDDARVATWEAKFNEGVALAEVADINARWGRASVRLSGPVP